MKTSCKPNLYEDEIPNLLPNFLSNDHLLH